MNETNTTSSSSAAAVADSASAAASTKMTTAHVPNSTTAAAAANSANNTSVKLLIKASNQQFDDQIIESDLLWTVKRLKTQLALVYPSKPPVAEQKLIYSGQLLNDALQLKDVIRIYKDVYTHNHIFHLVYTPKNAPSPNLSKKPKTPAPATMSASTSSASANADGLRQRHVAGSMPQQQQQQQQQQPQQPNLPYYAQQAQFQQQMMASMAAGAQCPPYNPQNMLPFSFPGQFNVQAMATQQAAMYNWMQQVYSHYMDQCMRLTNTVNAAGLANTSTPQNATGSEANVNALPPLPHAFLQQQLPFLAAQAAGLNAAGIATNPPVIPFPSATAEPATMAAPAAQQPEVVAAAAAAVAQPQEQQVAAPRFPNIVQEEADNRDWLDSFFSITRLAIFLTILYFNSSPLRCLVVVIIASGIYLYHIGVFRLRHERNNNNINRNNNAAADADQIRQGVRQVQQAQAAQENAPAEGAAANAAEVNAPDATAEAANGDAAAAVNADAPAAESVPPATSNENAAPADPAVAVVAENADNNSTSVISFVRTFVVTFFTSLLPETPAL